ncbi:hybrid sensor histidine kinase/response regulator [Pseudoalteromonas sp. MMG022]|uniref:hybrid sensor histidine kinase/response regulator n=1 Tax=Pseudoalteromonas sp. MMG022 TaxID=2909978 RepID=UPI001F4208C0|nr:hybrid sensor histidine kinase/response regulator [Pseudoalteromonas sp. MMG022]MCF6437632.1 ATP-binding protein [Pseudoalteromonas sp. MMG022]
MQNASQIKIPSLMPLIIITALITGAMCATASFFIPTTQKAPQLDIQATKLSAPLASLMVKSGFDDAKKMLASVEYATDDIQYYLYSHTGASKPEIIYQSSSDVPSTLSTVDTRHDNNTVVTHQPLHLDGQLVGELILRYQSTSSSSLIWLGYAGFILAALVALLMAWLSSRRVASELVKHNQQLQEELQSIINSQDYHAHISSQLGFGLNHIAGLINQLLNQIQSVIESDQEVHKELKQLQTSLETEVQARTLALEKATLNAERASEAKTTFLATMSHEIRTPMNGVIGTIDLLRQTELDGAQHRLSTIIRDSAFSLLGILDDILDFSKIEAGKLQIDSRTFSVTETVEEVARVLSSVAKKRKLDLQLSIAPDIPNNLVGDTVRVRQVLYNLCSNAIKFTTTDEDKQGFVRISAEVAQNTSEHYTLRFTVSDNGKGMDQKQLREIFNPFIQAEGSITREFGGTGLGLSICKSLIELMLGSIHVSSDIGMGSEFIVELPFSTDGQVQHVNKSVLNQKEVVMITDNRDRQKILQRYLSFMGAKTTTHNSFDDADDFQHKQSIIWVLDGLENMADVNDQIRSLLYSLENNNQQVIVLSTMDEAAINHKNIFYLNASPLCKTSFMTAVLVAAGLHQPKQLKPTRTLNNYLSVEQAKQQNRLVLLVEDNILNQQVLVDQLHLLGYGVEVAENGEQGLEVWKSGTYPIILTDLHMPRMSGYDMVKEIRDLAEKSDDINAQPYIIAVTANALKGERERCLSAGMNDYITKPVELNVLEATLQKYLDSVASKKPHPEAATEQAQATEQTNDLQPSTNSCPINLETLSKYVNYDEAKQRRFFRMYLEQSSQLTREIYGAVISMDQDAIVESCHQLKSISNTIGAEQVAKAATEFEAQCKAQQLESDTLIALRDGLDQVYTQATLFIQNYLQTPAPDEE